MEAKFSEFINFREFDKSLKHKLVVSLKILSVNYILLVLW